MVQVDPRDMLTNFCFHVYAQKSLFVGEYGNGFFFDILIIIILTRTITVHRASSQVKKLEDNGIMGMGGHRRDYALNTLNQLTLFLFGYST